MLSYSAVDIYGGEITLPAPSYITLNQDEDVPADDIALSFSAVKNLPELCEITVKENGQTVFLGIVDEQQTIVGESSVITRVVARSKAAALLDNESKPVSYYCPSTSVITSRHLSPFGITTRKGEELVLKESLNIPKGTTNWQALYSFCMRAYGRAPRVEVDGTVNFNGVQSSESFYFSNTDGIKYISLKENNKRCKLISDVWVKLSDGDGYILDVENEKAKERQIVRERYLDATGAYTSPTVAETMIRNSTDNSYELTIVTSERLLNVLGAEVSVSDEYIGRKDGLYVSSLYYSLTPDSERTALTLKRRNKNVDT